MTEMIQSKNQIFLINQDNPQDCHHRDGSSDYNNKKNGQLETSSSNWAGDLFWPLVILLRIVGQSPLTYTRSNGGSSSSSDQNNINGGRKRQETAQAKNFVIRSDSAIISPHPVYTLQTSEDDLIQGGSDGRRHGDSEIGGGGSCGGDREYRIVFPSIFLLVSVGIGLLFAFNWTAITLDVGFGIKHLRSNMSVNVWWMNIRAAFQRFVQRGLTNSTLSEKEAKLAMNSILEAGRVALTLIPLSQLLELICSWAETGLFSRFLNNWACFQQEYASAFPFYQQLEQTSLTLNRNLLFIFYAGLPTLTVWMASFFFTDFVDLKHVIWSFFIMLPFALHSITSNLLEDIKVILSYRVTADAFLKIKNGMTYSIQWEKLTAEKVKSWRGLVHKVRQQAVLAGRYQKTHQLILITISMVLITDLVFILLNGTWTVEGSWIFFTLCLGYAVVLTGRIYIKILAADRITHNEALISKELTGINASELAVQLEVKFLHDMIRQNPTTISFGNYVTLNKRLILGIASQVVTYLIVLMQFAQSKE